MNKLHKYKRKHSSVSQEFISVAQRQRIDNLLFNTPNAKVVLFIDVTKTVANDVYKTNLQIEVRETWTKLQQWLDNN